MLLSIPKKLSSFIIREWFYIFKRFQKYFSKKTLQPNKKEILISPIDNRDKILLDLGKDQHVVTVRSQVYLADGRQFQFTESRHKLDKFHFVDYAERRK